MVGLFTVYILPLLLNFIPWIFITSYVKDEMENLDYLKAKFNKLGNISYELPKKIKITKYFAFPFYTFLLIIVLILSLISKYEILRIVNPIVTLILFIALANFRIKSKNYKNLYAMYDNGFALYDEIHLWDELPICFINHESKLEFQTMAGLRRYLVLSPRALEWFQINVKEKH